MSAPEVPLLAGRYAMGAVLGVGGMAEVLEGIDVRLGRRVALKVLRPELARDPAFQARFRREAQAAASLDAPCIVSVYDTGEDADGVPFIVMERVDGRTLREVLQSEGRLLPQRALEVVADVCGALQVAHEAGIVHRDVKPGNVMLTAAGEVKVMDFGIARALADSAVTMTQTAAVIGTAAYLSPEQARGEHVDARSDLYSAGCLLYELVTGVPPFTGDSPVAVAYQHVREEPVRPGEYDPTLSPDVEAVVLKAMAKSPSHRYQSATLMREDLLRAAAGEPVEAALPLAPEASGSTVLLAPRPARASGTRRAVVLSLFGLLLVGLAASTALLVRGLLGNDTGLVEAPALVGLTQEQAVKELADRGLRLGMVDPQFEDRAAGVVLKQNPKKGVAVRRDGVVALTVSLGIDFTVVPNVVGQDRDAAGRTLETARLGVGAITSRDGNVPAGQVLAVQPQAGAKERAGRSVDLVVASGRVEVPDVRGRPQDDAVRLLRAAGLSVAVQPRDDPGPTGLVIRQDPTGTSADRSSVVTIGISRTPPPPPPSPSPEPFFPPPSPAPSPTPSASPAASPRRTPSPVASASPTR